MKLQMISTPNCAECKAAKQMLEMRGHEVEPLIVGQAEGIDLNYVISTFAERRVPQFQVAMDEPILGGYEGALKYCKDNS